MKRRQGNNPKRRVIDPAQINSQMLAELAAKARYVGSGHHKRYPANYNFRVTNPRPTKSLCDIERHFPLEDAVKLMQAGISLSMLSELGNDGMPKYIWAVSDEGEVFECKTDKSTPWQYHGYPINNEKNFSAYILSEWSKRNV